MARSLLALIFMLTTLAVAPVVWAASADRATPAEIAAANALLEAGRHTDARAAFEKILTRVPDDPEANYSVGLFACDDGDWEKALRCAQKAVASDANNARFQFCWGAANGIAALKGGVFSKFGYAKKCLAAYERAVELDPASVKYRTCLLNYYEQAPGFIGGDMAKAYAQAAAIKKLNAEQGRQAFVQLYLGEKKFEEALRQFDEALRETPDNYEALYQFGKLTLTTERRLDEGMAALRHCLELTPTHPKDTAGHASVHWRLGNIWEKKKDPAKAREEYLEALKLKPDFLPAKQALEKLDAGKRP